MVFRPYDTRLRQQVNFEPLTPQRVTIYNCGPTVYSTPHIGNFRSFLFADLLRRTLEYRGFSVLQVMNITDVGHLTEDDRADAAGEDKLQRKARELGWDPFKVARTFEEEFHRDRRALRIQDAHHYPRATEHVADMLVQIQQLLDSGHAYIPPGTAEVYYDISSFPEYGELSGKRLEELAAGARVEINRVKRHPTDFALWKTDPGHLMQWDPHAEDLWRSYPGTRPALDRRIGRGFPGWHIECSAMSARYLGREFDLHTGGEDNIFPHHECEIAQAKGSSGGNFARYWMHARHLLVNGRKMSKSEGTLYTLQDLTGRGYSPLEVRYLLISNHYRQPMNFTFEGLEAARASIARLQTCRDLLELSTQNADESAQLQSVGEIAGRFEASFGDALDDDLNVANALAALFEFVADVNRIEPSGEAARLALATLDSADDVFGVLNRQARAGFISKQQLEATEASTNLAAVKELLTREPLKEADVRQLALCRHTARRSKNWPVADAIRDGLKQRGVVFEDTPEGVRFKLR